MRHLLHVTRYALRRPRIAWRGIREFRWDFTKHYEDLDQAESYDAGREIAHLATFRRFEI